MISYNDMPPSAQRSYRITNTTRKIVMFIGWIIVLLVLISLFAVKVLKTADINMLSVAFLALIFFFVIHALFIHLEFVYKTIYSKLWWIGIIILIPFVWTVAGLFSWVFLLVDTILFLLKKPLIYPFENKYFIRTRDAVDEMRIQYQAELVNAVNNSGSDVPNNADTISKLQELKELLDRGLITEEEFNRKKNEVLDRI
ncbi:MAG: SHOCT domain-containing protein [Lachnospiraceae bacterium]|nr:SHOCT domain-containing protein [Lachnospiraceae bacterium]